MSEHELQPSTERILCYLFPPFTGIIFILIEHRKELLFHAWQSALFGGAVFGAWLVVSIVATIFGAIANVLGAAVGLLIPLIKIAGVVLWLYAIVRSYQGHEVRFPVISELAQKKAGV